MKQFRMQLAIALFFLSVFRVHAETEVEDIGSATQTRTASSATTNSQPVAQAWQGNDSASTNELFYQLQQLQHEVLELRGLVEQQAYEIKVLKQQRLDDYVDLDRRISELQTGGENMPVKEGGSALVGTSSVDAGVIPEFGASDEKASYSLAYNLLKQRQVDEAIAAFTQHIETFPKGLYVPNAYYWLGEIYFLKGHLEKAEKQFSFLLETYPEHRKVPDAQFKLGKVYFEKGMKKQAQQLIQEVASGSSQAARLAQNFLDTNF